MDCPTLATGIVFGETGLSILKALDEAGIKHDFVFSKKGNSRQNLKLLDLKADEVTEIGGVGGEVDGSLLSEFIEKYTHLLNNAELVVLSGSAPHGVPSDIYATLITIAKKAGIKSILDADGDLLKNGIKAAPYMIKPNIFELQRLIGKEVDEKALKSSAKELLDLGIELVTISMGKNGSVFSTQEQTLKVEALEIKGGCATGAGDSMVAASAFGITHGFDLSSIARYASAAGSATASNPGTEVCSMDDITYNEGKIEISLI